MILHFRWVTFTGGFLYLSPPLSNIAIFDFSHHWCICPYSLKQFFDNFSNHFLVFFLHFSNIGDGEIPWTKIINSPPNRVNSPILGSWPKDLTSLRLNELRSQVGFVSGGFPYGCRKMGQKVHRKNTKVVTNVFFSPGWFFWVKRLGVLGWEVKFRSFSKVILNFYWSAIFAILQFGVWMLQILSMVQEALVAHPRRNNKDWGHFQCDENLMSFMFIAMTLSIPLSIPKSSRV